LNEITERVCRSAKDALGDKLEKVILYGSYARGDSDEYSDIDIFVLASIPQEDCCDKGLEILDCVGALALEHNILICPKVVCSATFRQYSNVLPFYMNVLKEGIELYAA
jgi:predicted nucleotidyltransferase